jgi:hypothetical protein
MPARCTVDSGSRGLYAGRWGGRGCAPGAVVSPTLEDNPMTHHSCPECGAWFTRWLAETARVRSAMRAAIRRKEHLYDHTRHPDPQTQASVGTQLSYLGDSLDDQRSKPRGSDS